MFLIIDAFEIQFTACKWFEAFINLEMTVVGDMLRYSAEQFLTVKFVHVNYTNRLYMLKLCLYYYLLYRIL